MLLLVRERHTVAQFTWAHTMGETDDRQVGIACFSTGLDLATLAPGTHLPRMESFASHCNMRRTTLIPILEMRKLRYKMPTTLPQSLHMAGQSGLCSLCPEHIVRAVTRLPRQCVCSPGSHLARLPSPSILTAAGRNPVHHGSYIADRCKGMN